MSSSAAPTRRASGSRASSPTKVNYMAMLGNNLSQLGVSAAQLDNHLHTQSLMLNWLPTTGEFGLFRHVRRLRLSRARRHPTRRATTRKASRTSRDSRAPNSIENSQIRLTDGSIIFTPDLFGPGITVENVHYYMASIDAGVKYKGFARSRVLLAHAERLQRNERRRASPTSTTTGFRCSSRRWRFRRPSSRTSAVADLRQLWRPFGVACRARTGTS